MLSIEYLFRSLCRHFLKKKIEKKIEKKGRIIVKLNKTEKIVIILSTILIFGISIFFIIIEHQTGINVPISANVTINSTDSDSDNSSDEGTNLAIMSKNICEGCHMSGRRSVPQAMIIKPHLEGGSYCLICHNFSHSEHPINVDVTCEKCHGFRNTSIPVSGPNIICINCHDYPNPLNKSFGNLLTIHRSREISCINCHADKCTECHKEIGNGIRWEKRFIHFRTILGKSYKN